MTDLEIRALLNQSRELNDENRHTLKMTIVISSVFLSVMFLALVPMLNILIMKMYQIVHFLKLLSVDHIDVIIKNGQIYLHKYNKDD